MDDKKFSTPNPFVFCFRFSVRNFWHVVHSIDRNSQLASYEPVRLADGGWLVLICSERKVLLADYWWLVCSERKVLLAGG
jgi:hypothetical protein